MRRRVVAGKEPGFALLATARFRQIQQTHELLGAVVVLRGLGNLLHRREHGVGTVETLLGMGGQGLAQPALDVVGQAVELLAVFDLAVHRARLQDFGGARSEQGLTREHLVGNRPQRIEIRTRVDPQPRGLFGRHVVHLALDRTRGRAIRPVLAAGNAEVGDLDLRRPRNQQVLRTDVAVHDALQPAVPALERVDVAQCHQRLAHDLEGNGRDHDLLVHPVGD